MYMCLNVNLLIFLHFTQIPKDFINIHENETKITYLYYSMALATIDSIFRTLGLLVTKIQVYLNVYLLHLFHFFSQFHKFSLIYMELKINFFLYHTLKG